MAYDTPGSVLTVGTARSRFSSKPSMIRASSLLPISTRTSLFILKIGSMHPGSTLVQRKEAVSLYKMDGTRMVVEQWAVSQPEEAWQRISLRDSTQGRFRWIFSPGDSGCGLTRSRPPANGTLWSGERPIPQKTIKYSACPMPRQRPPLSDSLRCRGNDIGIRLSELT